MRFSGRFAATTMVVLACAFPSWAAIVTGGDIGQISPASPSTWTSSTTGYVGQSSGKSGTITVSGASGLTSSYGYLGNVSGSAGTVTVTGTGSRWTAAGDTYVGYNGTGSLVITNGGAVISALVEFGYRTGATGTALVDGAGSTWTTSRALRFGLTGGTGTLTVTNGGAVTVASLYASPANLLGNGTITTRGVVTDMDWVLTSTQSLKSFGNGGTLILNASGTMGDLGAGYQGQGSLLIGNGVSIKSASGYIGYNEKSIGTATVTGTGSTWDTSGSMLTVGYSGNGTLTVTNGGKVNSGGGYIGNGFRSAGAMTVTGTGSTWNMTDFDMYVGWGGSGTLTVTNGGTVTGGIGHIAGYITGTGTARVTGTGSLWNMRRNALYVGDVAGGNLTVDSAGKVFCDYAALGNTTGAAGAVTVTGGTFSTTNSGAGNGGLDVGYNGRGTLLVQGGGKVVSNGANLGFNASSINNVATVTGTGSSWSTGGNTFYVGKAGSGTLTITNSGAVASAAVDIGCNSGAVGTVLVNGAGSTWTSTGAMRFGSSGGTGTLTVTNGGAVTVGCLYASPGNLLGNATITARGSVSDIDLTLTSTQCANSFGSGGTLLLDAGGQMGELGAGYKGPGSLLIGSGVNINSATGYLGLNAGSTGVVTVTGSGTTWNTGTNSLYVGNSGCGTLTITSGGTVAGGVGQIAYNVGSTGAVTVTGTGSTWNTNNNCLYVGNLGSSTLTVTNGGTVSSADGYVGYGSGTTGAVTVTGTGSTWNTNHNHLYVGSSGSGTLTVTNGGAVSCGSASLGYNTDGSGTVTVTGGTLSTSVLTIGESGRGSLLVQGGGKVTSSYGAELGGSTTGTNNTATVTGPGSSWNTGGNTFYVGMFGSATLAITNGGTVTSASIGIGSNRSEVVTALVDGAGTTWTATGGLGFGSSGTATLTVTNGAAVTVGSLGACPANLLGNGTIVARGSVSDMDLILTSTQCANSFGTGGTLLLDASGQMNGLGAGYRGRGSLLIGNGVNVSSATGSIGSVAGSAGVVTVTGAGTTWNTNNNWLYVGSSGSGTLVIANGGSVTNKYSIMGAYAGSNGTATVTGAGSMWANVNELYVGDLGTGRLTVGDGGTVTASRLDIGTAASTVNLHVASDSMMVVGTSGTLGIVINEGKVNLFADAFLLTGTYAPITEYAGRAMTWTGAGTYKGTGGLWNDANKTFTVSTATALAAGDVDPLTTGERVLFTDSAGKRVGASFGTVAGGTTFSATGMDAGQLSGLSPADGEGVLSAWYFNTNFSGGSALLAFDVGLGQSDLKVWRYDGTAWAAFAADDLIYDSHGIASFMVNGFSGYAVTGDVPEPATLSLLALGGLAILRRRRAG